MNATSDTGRLYTPDILALAVELADHPICPEHVHSAEVRSRSCGSTIAVGLNVDTEGAVKSIGLRVSACAIGQASAALFARSIAGKTRADLEQSLNTIEIWLAGAANQPSWPDLELLAKAKAYPGRHEAILLPWRAAISALSKG